MSDFKPVPGEFTGRHMLIVMIGFFGVIIGVNLLLATVASRSWTGLVVDNSYVASQNFNAGLEAAREQAKLGWKSRLQIDGQTAEVTFSDGNGALETLSVTLKLSRPTHEAADRTIELREANPGHYRSPVQLDPGVWNAELIAVSPAGDGFRERHRFVIASRAGS